MQTLSPPHIQDRFDVYRFYNGLSVEGKEGLDKRRTRIPLVKSFLLEHIDNKRNDGRQKTPEEIFRTLVPEIRRIDDTFTEIRDDVKDTESKTISRQTTGFLEVLDNRFFAYYTCEASIPAKRRVGRWVQSPDLDHTWFSSPLLQALWNGDVSKRGDDRFGKLIFSHESIFDMPDDSATNDSEDEDSEETNTEESDEENHNEEKVEFERRKARFEMKDRVGKIKQSLQTLQENYAPLYALYGLRLPSFSGRGGHDLWQNGQITNRTDCFEAHRNTVNYLYKIYKAILDNTEEAAWPGTQSKQAFHMGTRGAPLIMKFDEPLSEAIFNRWVQRAFQKKNPFKLWGVPISLGRTKVHVYGADRHLWQPINLEITASGMVAILPQGTCGNTIHRLVANVQHYVSPKIEAWVGGTPYTEIVKQASEVPYEA